MRSSLDSPIFLGIDVGTGSTKGVLADIHGKYFATASSSYQYTSPKPTFAEQNPLDWWRAVCIVSQQLISENPEASARISGIAVSGQGVACVVLDEDGAVLRDAPLWMDTRAVNQAERLAKEHGETIAQISGKGPASYNVEPKLLWLRENEPALWREIAKVTTTGGFINYRLTGRAVMNRSDAGLMLAYDLRRREWSRRILGLLDLSENLFCDLAECDEIIGFLQNEAASEMGLPAGIPIVAGGEDTSSAAIALGVVAENDVLLSMGTASTVYMPTRFPYFDSRLVSFPHALKDVTLTGGSMVAGGNSIQWLVSLVRGDDAEPNGLGRKLFELENECRSIPCGSNGLIFLPYLAGELQPINDGLARGIFFGLQLDTRPAHLLRAVVEGMGFAIRHNLDILKECGAEPKAIKAVGGPVQSDFWCQTIADITGLQIDASDGRLGAAFGDTVIAALGVHSIHDPLLMQQVHHRVRETFHPRKHTELVYKSAYGIYRELYPRLSDLFPQLRSSSVSLVQEQQ